MATQKWSWRRLQGLFCLLRNKSYILSFNFSEAERKTGKSVKSRLNDALQSKLDEVEKKREKMILLDKKIAKLGEGPEKRKLVYQKQTQENYNRKHKKAPIDEERAAHESYQILLKVHLIFTHLGIPYSFIQISAE